MVRIRALIVTFILILALFPAFVSAKALISIQPLNTNFPALPGTTVVVPFSIRNMGNETVSNVTVYVAGPTSGFQYAVKVIPGPIPPGGTFNGTVSVTVVNPEPGNYTMKVIAKAGNIYSEAPITVSVKSLIDYFPEIDVGKKYIYGNDVGVTFKVFSRSNTIISGRVGYNITLDGRPFRSGSSVIFVKVGGVWAHTLLLHRPPLGNYTVTFWANMSGVFKKTTATFLVYQRHLSYNVSFRGGAIKVFVFNASGTGVPGIKVYINGMAYTTDDSGAVYYIVTSPGVYRIVLDLDGKIVRTSITVEKLSISTFQEGDALYVRVTGGNSKPVPNVTVSALGPSGTVYGVTNASGVAVINLTRTGYGSIVIKAKSSRYLGSEVMVTAVKPSPPPLATNTTTTPSHTTSSPAPSPAPITTPPRKGSSALPLILILSGVILAVTSYAAFFRPSVVEETLDRYYFVKVRAPRMRPLDGFRFERPVTAVEAWAEKGTAVIKDGKVIWEIEHLEPGEEAYLQVLLD